MDNEVLDIFEKHNAIIKGHFVLTSGLHSNRYFAKDRVMPHTKDASEICQKIAMNFADDSIEAVIAPALGGITLSNWTAHHLSEVTDRDVLALYSENENGLWVLRNDMRDLIMNKRTLLVEDTITTGGSIKGVLKTIVSICEVAGVGTIFNQGEVTADDLGVPKLVSLVKAPGEIWKEPCPLCKQGVAVNTTVGKGAQFIARNLSS